MSPDGPTRVATAVPARPRPGLRAALVLGGTLLATLAASGVLPAPDVAGRLAGLSDVLGAWTYLLVPGLAFLETAALIGLVTPGETAVLLGGVVAQSGEVSLVPLIVLVWIAAVAGDVVSLLLGRHVGPTFLRRHGSRIGIRPEHLARVEVFFDHHGGRAILFGRFVGILRAFTPFVAGSMGLSVRRMLPWSVGGALVWSAGFTLVGYAFADSFESAGELLTRGTLLVLILAVLVVALRRARRRADRRRSLNLTSPRPQT